MNRSDHERARDLIMAREIEAIASNDAAWISSHLAECSDCTHFAEALQLTSQVLRRMPVTAPARLVTATQLRVRGRAAELRERSLRNFLIAISFCLGVMSSAVTSFLWWKFGGLVAERFGLPLSIVQPGLFVASTLPAVIIALFMLVASRPVIDRSLTIAFLAEHEGGRK